jgi:hypothetical protein
MSKKNCVFSLVCEECDAGSDLATMDDAIAAGWAEIDYAPDLPMANFCGVCPECQSIREAREAAAS